MPGVTSSRPPHRFLRPTFWRILVVVCVGLTLAACQLKTEVNLAVESDGSGTVEVAVGLDDDALGRSPGVLDDLAVDDLVEAGWVITGPAKEVDDFTWVRAVHDFDAPSEVGPLVAQIAGSEGPFRDFSLERSTSFASTDFTFAGVVDFTAGARTFTDDAELTEALGADPTAVIEERIGSAVDQVIDVTVAVRLPGTVDSNAPTKADNGAVWRPSVIEGEAISLSATSSQTETSRLVLVGAAVVVAIVLVLFIAIRVVLWRRRRAGLA